MVYGTSSNTNGVLTGSGGFLLVQRIEQPNCVNGTSSLAGGGTTAPLVALDLTEDCLLLGRWRQITRTEESVEKHLFQVLPKICQDWEESRDASKAGWRDTEVRNEVSTN